MTNSETIPSREDNLNNLRKSYSEMLYATKLYLEKKDNTIDPYQILYSFHSKGVEYFNSFERTIDEYSLENYKITNDLKTKKAEDTLNIISSVLNHWKLVHKFCKKYNLSSPTPSVTSYASMQRIIKSFYPDEIERLKGEFVAENLPIYGFMNKEKHSKWKKSIKWPLIYGTSLLAVTYILIFIILKLNDVSKIQIAIGLPLLIVSGYLIFTKNDITGIQFILLKAMLSLSISSLAVAVITGSINLRWELTTSLVVTAGGGFAIFILLYFLNPQKPPKLD